MTEKAVGIYPYHPGLEDSWVRCKALSFLYSQFKDQITSKKDTYTEEEGYADSIEWVAVHSEEVVGILDIGIFNDDQNHSYPYSQGMKMGAYMDILAVHPDFQRRGIAQQLIDKATHQLREKGIDYLSIFTRDDEGANCLYKKLGAELIATNYRIKGKPKEHSMDIGLFQVDVETKTIKVADRKGKEVPYMFDSGYYWVYKKENLSLFDIEDQICEHSYLLRL